MARLSKNRILDGIQCPKLLWLRVHEPDAPELVPGTRTQALFDAGHDVGVLARERFPTGVLVDVDRSNLAAALKQTRRLVDLASVPIFEACFVSDDGVFVAVDVLEPGSGGWAITECKATTSTKPHHVADLAVQVHALRSSGLRVARARLMHLNRDFRSPDFLDLFTIEDLTDQVEAELAAIPALVERLARVIESDEPPIEPGPRCRKPHACPFIERCAEVLPKHHVGELYRLHATKRDRLGRSGIKTIAEIPDRFDLTPTQQMQREAIRRGELVVMPGLAERFALSKPPPRSYLDFETISVPIPRWDGCWPWQQVPVQWSLHVEREDGSLEHHEYLGEPEEDPRPAFARALVEAVPKEGPVIVYFEQFERGRLRELADAVPDLAEAIMAIDRRSLDLLEVVRDHVYHPDFGGSFSIKRVFPVLCPGEGWGDLEVASGDVAMVELARLLLDGGALSQAERSRLRERLLRYCERDTFAMVALVKRLRELALP